ncbi:hypothetical protein K445DRAFT_280979 [Daldinia sp. EC12]|nr:hypothetical protein F4774DRAFT_147778 [Daldinia eschscholtzii]OTB09769.1 hypothetical protein K445DRAFT_280979 [Daldinia sp. EC12]
MRTLWMRTKWRVSWAPGDAWVVGAPRKYRSLIRQREMKVLVALLVQQRVNSNLPTITSSTTSPPWCRPILFTLLAIPTTSSGFARLLLPIAWTCISGYTVDYLLCIMPKWPSRPLTTEYSTYHVFRLWSFTLNISRLVVSTCSPQGRIWRRSISKEYFATLLKYGLHMASGLTIRRKICLASQIFTIDFTHQAWDGKRDVVLPRRQGCVLQPASP